MAGAVAAGAGLRRLPEPGSSWAFVNGIIQGLKTNKPYGFLRQWHDEHGPLLKVKMPALAPVSIVDPTVLKYVTRNDPARFTKGTGYDSVKRGWLDNSLVVSEDEDWRKKRSIYNQAFKLGAIRSYVPLFMDIAESTADDWVQHHKRGEPVDAVKAFESVALEAIGRAGFGVEGLGKPGHKYAESFVSYLSILQDEMSKPAMLILPGPLRKLVTKFRAGHHLQEMNAEAKKMVSMDLPKASDASQETRRNLVALMQEANQMEGLNMDAEQLAREANLFLFAGHDTTSATLAWVWALLAAHPEVQEKAYEEVAAISDANLAEELSDPRKLPIIGAVIRETLRLYPPASMVMRNCKFDEELGGYFVPKGTDLMLNVWCTQRDKAVFEEPDSFDPFRWLQPEGEKLKRMQDHWIAFMIGARSCIGQQFSTMEMRVLISMLLRRFKAEPAPNSKPQLTQRMLLLPADIHLRCSPRA